MGFVVDIFLPLALAFIMFALGIGLTVDDFTRVVRRPRDFLVGAAAQMVLLPLVAFALVSVWPMPAELALGLMIIAAAPGGVTSNILTAFARGDVALSISLTAVTSLLSVLTIPLIVVAAYAHLIGGSTAQDVSVTRTALSVFAIVTVPVLAGLAFRRFAARLALRIEPAARTLSTVLFVVVLAGAIFQERANIADYMARAGLVTLTLNVAMMALAFALAALLASGPRQRVAISLECGLQNGTLAIAVATLLFGGGLAVVPAATYSLIMFATGLLFVALLRRTLPAGGADPLGTDPLGADPDEDRPT
ncbi:MAG: bile acid:sodium symporter family protein [Thalassobaculaceae bacterium]